MNSYQENHRKFFQKNMRYQPHTAGLISDITVFIF